MHTIKNVGIHWSTKTIKGVVFWLFVKMDAARDKKLRIVLLQSRGNNLTYSIDDNSLVSSYTLPYSINFKETHYVRILGSSGIARASSIYLDCVEPQFCNNTLRPLLGVIGVDFANDWVPIKDRQLPQNIVVRVKTNDGTRPLQAHFTLLLQIAPYSFIHG